MLNLQDIIINITLPNYYSKQNANGTCDKTPISLK
jgi:hypothetical protein